MATSQLQQYDTEYGCYSVELLHMNISRTEINNKSTWSRVTGITTCVLVVFVVVTNSMFILGLVKTNKRNMTLGQKLFIYMSSVDLLNGLSAMPYLAVFSLSGISCLAMSFMVAFTTFTVLSSASTLALISVIRLRSIMDPFNPRNGKRLTILVIVQGVVSIGFAGIIFKSYLHASSLSFLVPITCGISIVLFSLQAGVVGSNIYSLVYLKRQKVERLQHQATTCHCKIKDTTKVGQQQAQHSHNGSDPKTRVQPQVSQSSKGFNSVSTTAVQLQVPHSHKSSDSAGAKFLDRQSKNHREAAKTLLMISIFLGLCILVQTFLAAMIFTKAGDKDIHLDDFIKVLDLIGNLKMIIDMNCGMNALVCLCRSRKIQKYYKMCMVKLLKRS